MNKQRRQFRLRPTMMVSDSEIQPVYPARLGWHLIVLDRHVRCGAEGAGEAELRRFMRGPGARRVAKFLEPK